MIANGNQFQVLRCALVASRGTKAAYGVALLVPRPICVNGAHPSCKFLRMVNFMGIFNP